MFYAFLMVVAIAGVGLYLFVILREVPGAAEERIGSFEALPENINRWEADPESAAGKAAHEQGLEREVRLFFVESSPNKLLRQVRYRNLSTRDIERVEPDQIVKRKRVKR